MKIIFATNNEHKLQEIRHILGNAHEVISLSQMGCHEDIPETGQTLQDNAWQKADWVAEHYGVDCVFADDTGLEVDVLNGEPGVYSARYAEGTSHNSQANMAKLLQRMEGQTDRRARFRTVIALLLHGKRHTFEGQVKGSIATAPRGEGGFGYDPIFVPEGYNQTFAELGEGVKNTISHRARAVSALAQFLQQL